MNNNRNTLLVQKTFIMHSGETGNFKIECDALTDEDIDTISWIIMQKYEKEGIKNVYGIPRGGIKLSNSLEKYWNPKGSIRLIVDDVFTTGRSMSEAREKLGWDNAKGVVIFARKKTPEWITPVFSMDKFFT
jgi:hypoxanthine phosphoribosyltransferase